jgi:urease accessory protein UreF
MLAILLEPGRAVAAGRVCLRRGRTGSGAADAALLGALFSWAENQVLVCVKTVPLGQVAGQKMLLALAPAVEDVAARACAARPRPVELGAGPVAAVDAA